MTSKRPHRPRQHGFSLIEVLLVLAIISVMAAMVINAFSNATQDSRNVVARQQQAALQSAISNWATAQIGRKLTIDPDGAGALPAKTYEFSVGLTRSLYNYTDWYKSTPTALRTAHDRLALVGGYLDDDTIAHFDDNSPDAVTAKITSAAMVKTGTYLQLPKWDDTDLRAYPKVDLIQP
jgi:prepilin-type N-terminal cleavage/methylation domain-containing protein